MYLPHLTDAQRARFERLASATTLTDLLDITGVESTDDAYLSAKREWRDLTDAGLPPASASSELPGDRIEFDGLTVHVHGITHADTAAERRFVRDRVSAFTDDGAFVYCEQGIRPMYFEGFDRVCEMDDYRWAAKQCRDLESATHLEDVLGAGGGLMDDFHDATDELRSALFSLIETGSDLYGHDFATAIGDVATAFLTRPTDLSVGRDYRSFELSRRASTDPTALERFQRYYKTAFLPPPIERAWLRRHDPELELVTHARNERMADYVMHHNDEASRVHVLVGGAHQPGVTYYLGRYRDGERTEGDFELSG
ncbi:MAG: hypothetical protein ACLFMX_02675 [Halobacteriales archaeon]